MNEKARKQSGAHPLTRLGIGGVKGLHTVRHLH